MKLKAVVFDWAGTIIDHGSRAPMGAFVKVLSEFQVPITVEEARRPMGLPKWDHIKALLTHPEISARWKAVHGQMPTDRDVDRVFEVFVPLNAAVVADFADVIPGVLETIAQLRARGLKIGSTTGYTRDIMDRLLPIAAKKGLVLDNLGVRRRPRIRPPWAAHDVQVLPRSRCRTGVQRGQGRRHGGRNCGRPRSRMLDGRRDAIGQCGRFVAGRACKAERGRTCRATRSSNASAGQVRCTLPDRQRGSPRGRDRPNRGATCARRAAVTRRLAL